MKRTYNRAISLILILSLLSTLLPSEVFAEEKSIISVEAGGCYSAMLDSEGKLWIWGDNECKQLGIEDQDKITAPMNIMSDVKKVKLGDDHTAAIKSDNTLWLWGDNIDFECGDSESKHGISPFKVMDDVKDVDLSLRNTVILKNDGTVWVLGYNCYGQYGNGSEGNESSIPIQANIDDVKSVKAGWDAIGALKKDGSLWLWGLNDEFQLGLDGECILEPVKILDNVKSFDLGANHAAAIKTDGSLWVWGSNSEGQVGDGTFEYVSKPKKILEDVESIELGTYCSAAIKTDGSLWIWGLNNCYQVDSSGNSISIPTNLLDNVQQVSLGGFHDNYKTHVLALTNDGNVWGWGNNSFGQLGNGTTEDLLVPTLIFEKGSIDQEEDNDSYNVTYDLDEWIKDPCTYQNMMFLANSANFPCSIYIEKNYGTYGQAVERYIVDALFYRGFEGWADIKSDAVSVSSAEQTLVGLLEMIQTDDQALSKTKTAQKWAKIVCDAFSNYLNYQNNLDGISNSDIQLLSSVLKNEDKVSEMFLNGSFSDLKSNLIKELNLPDDSPTLKLVDDFIQSKELISHVSKGLSWLGTGLNLLSVTAETIDRYYQLNAIYEANDAYIEMLSYIRDDCLYPNVSQAASNLIEIHNGNSAQVISYVEEAVIKEGADTALNGVLDLACNQLPILWGVKTGLKMGTGIANLAFHTSDTVVLKDSMMSISHIARCISSWMIDNRNAYLKESDPEKKDELAKKTAYSFYMSIQARKAGEEAIQKLMECNFNKRSSYYKNSKSAGAMLYAIEEYMKSYGITPAYLSVVLSCPVDVEILKDNQVIATIQDGVESTGFADTVSYSVVYNELDQDYMKIFQIPVGSDYTLRAIGKDTGLVDFTIYKPDDQGLLQVSEASNIPVQEGSTVLFENVGTETKEAVLVTDGKQTTYNVEDLDIYNNEKFTSVDSIISDVDNLEITIGKQVMVKVTIEPLEATIKDLDWVSSDEAVATVNSDGVVSTLKEGECDIVVTSQENPEASSKIHVSVREIKPVSIELDPSALTLKKGASKTLTVTFNPADVTNSSILWTSSNYDVATVDTSGKITAVAAGTANITATTSNGKTATCKVTVTKPAVTSVSLNKTSAELWNGESVSLSATVAPINADTTITWKTSNSSVATVSNGKVTAKAKGTATITATSVNGKTATCKVTVKGVKPTSVTLSKSTASVDIGSSLALTATVKPSGADQTVTWTSSDSSVARVSNGTVKGVKAGTATITAKNATGLTATCKVTVTVPAATSVSLNKSSTTIVAGSSETLIATVYPTAASQSVTWTSSNTAVATVSGGKVTGVKAGSATITAKTSNGKTATCKVTISNAAATKVTLSSSSVSLKAGGTTTLTASVSPSTASQTVTWTSSNTGVAKVSNGKITAVSVGTATITAKSADGKVTATCKVTVSYADATSVTLSKTSLSVAKGNTSTLTATVKPTTANQSVTWKTSDSSVAKVSSGKVTGVKAGKATITATSADGKKSATCTVTVSGSSSSTTTDTVPVYRLYSALTGEHLYTSDKNEYDTLYKKYGWGQEGIGWYAPTSGTAVYRLYQPGLKNHLYTTDTNEVKVLTSKYGWVQDNNGEPLYYSGGTTPIYRVYNKGLNGMHHLTTDSNEYNTLPKYGWKKEGVALNAVKIGEPFSKTRYYNR